MIICRSKDEIAKIRRAGKIVAGALGLSEELMEPGITTGEINDQIEDLIKNNGATAAFKGYRGYPATVCISIDEEVVHGIPGARKIEEGQLVAVDVGVELDGYFADAARTFPVGAVSDEGRRLIECGWACLEAGIAKMRSGNHLYNISGAIEDTAADWGYTVVREYVGHGIGRAMHEEPQIPNYRQEGRGPRLSAGMVFALEPMVNAGGYEVEVMDDRWTVVTKDRHLSVHYEDTVVITEGGPAVLTK